MILLFGLDKKGGHKQWKCWTEGDKLFVQHGKVGGLQQTKEEVIKGKNIGRSNQTTPEDQAVFEMNSRANKQIDKGYRYSMEDLGELPISAMLANDYNKTAKRVVWPVYTSRKLDGVRTLAFKENGKVRLQSRGGKDYNVEHIQNSLLVLMREGEIWDGELYIHGLFLEEIVSAVKKPNKNTPNLGFIVFDVVNEKPFKERLQDLYKIQWSSCIRIIGYDSASTEGEMKRLHNLYVSEEYEGCMLRTENGLYESGKRSNGLFKYKEFMDEEFEIVGVEEDRNGNAVFKLYDPTAKEFFTCTYGDFEQRKYQLAHKEEFIGKMLTVKYQTRYKDSNLVQFPTGVAIRDYE